MCPMTADKRTCSLLSKIIKGLKRKMNEVDAGLRAI